jgi:hypothetical protein
VAIWVTKVKRIVTIQMSAPKDSATSADDPLRTFLEGLDRAELVDLLIESAHTEGIVQQRLERRRLATDPAQLAADFKRTLQGWKRSQRFIAYQEAHAFAASLQEWLDQIERELLPIQPALARELYEAFIVSDRRFLKAPMIQTGSSVMPFEALVRFGSRQQRVARRKPIGLNACTTSHPTTNTGRANLC